MLTLGVTVNIQSPRVSSVVFGVYVCVYYEIVQHELGYGSPIGPLLCVLRWLVDRLRS